MNEPQPDDEDDAGAGAMWLVLAQAWLLALPCVYLGWHWFGALITLAGSVITFWRLQPEALITPLCVLGNLGTFFTFVALIVTGARVSLPH